MPARSHFRTAAHLVLTATQNEVVLAVEVLDQVTGIGWRDPAIGQIVRVEGEQEFIHPAESECGVSGEHRAEDMPHKPRQLQALLEGLRRALRNRGTGIGRSGETD